MDLVLLIDHIKREADRLQEGGALSIEEAYKEAIVTIFRLAAEGRAVNPFEENILRAIRERNGRPVSTTALAVQLGVSSRFTMYNYLSELERRGLIERPRPKSGWVLAGDDRPQRMTA